VGDEREIKPANHIHPSGSGKRSQLAMGLFEREGIDATGEPWWAMMGQPVSILFPFGNSSGADQSPQGFFRRAVRVHPQPMAAAVLEGQQEIPLEIPGDDTLVAHFTRQRWPKLNKICIVRRYV